MGADEARGDRRHHGLPVRAVPPGRAGARQDVHPGQGRPRRRRVAHRERGPADAVEGVERARHRGRRRHEDRLAGALGAVRALRLVLLDDDHLDRGHARGRDDPLRLQRVA